MSAKASVSGPEATCTSSLSLCRIVGMLTPKKQARSSEARIPEKRIIPAARSFFQMIAIQPTINAQARAIKKTRVNSRLNE